MWLPTENFGLNKRGDWRKWNSQNEIWHWTNDEIGVVVHSWLWVRVELMTWKLCQLECLNGIQWSWVQLPLESTFYSYFKESISGEYHIYKLIWSYSKISDKIVNNICKKNVITLSVFDKNVTKSGEDKFFAWKNQFSLGNSKKIILLLDHLAVELDVF